MPNQLASSKRRLSLAEHEAVAAALTAIARRENTTVMALLRQAVRELVRSRAANRVHADKVRGVVWSLAPRMPLRFKTAAQVARFKRAQRDFDRVILDLQLARPAALQARNAVVSRRQAVRLVDFDSAHAAAAK